MLKILLTLCKGAVLLCVPLFLIFLVVSYAPWLFLLLFLSSFLFLFGQLVEFMELDAKVYKIFKNIKDRICNK